MKGISMRLPQWMILAVAVLLLANPTLLLAQANNGQKAKSQTVQGTVVSVASNGSFSMTDNSGATIMVRPNANTTYQFNKISSSFSATVQVGLTVKADVLPDGTVVQVTSKTPKNSALAPSKPLVSPSSPLKTTPIDQLQATLGASDEEWLVLRPMIVDIQSLQSQLSASVVALKSVQPPTLSLDETKTELATRRATQAQLAAQLFKARADLTKLVTLRQELVLLQLGIVE